MALPDHMGAQFTPTIHSKAEGPTDPKNNKVHSNFVVCITGAGKGLGYNIALAYAQAGAKGIVIASRTRADLEKLHAEIKEISPATEVLIQTCNVIDEDDVHRLALETDNKFGRLDVVVANAGIISKYITKADGKSYLPSGVIEDDDFDRVMQTNFMGCYRVAKYFTPLLLKTTDGVQAYIGITSIASHMSDSSFCPLAYNVSKLALNRMVEQMHRDHNENDGLLAFAVHPGGVLTPQTIGHNTTQRGEVWDQMLTDDVDLCGGFLTWLTAEKRDWLSGRYVAVNWDTEQLSSMKDDIVKNDKLTFKMNV